MSLHTKLHRFILLGCLSAGLLAALAADAGAAPRIYTCALTRSTTWRLFNTSTNQTISTGNEYHVFVSPFGGSLPTGEVCQYATYLVRQKAVTGAMLGHPLGVVSFKPFGSSWSQTRCQIDRTTPSSDVRLDECDLTSMHTKLSVFFYLALDHPASGAAQSAFAARASTEPGPGFAGAKIPPDVSLQCPAQAIAGQAFTFPGLLRPANAGNPRYTWSRQGDPGLLYAYPIRPAKDGSFRLSITPQPGSPDAPYTLDVTVTSSSARASCQISIITI